MSGTRVMTVFSDLLILHHVQKFSELLISYILVMFLVGLQMSGRGRGRGAPPPPPPPMTAAEVLAMQGQFM